MDNIVEKVEPIHFLSCLHKIDCSLSVHRVLIVICEGKMMREDPKKFIGHYSLSVASYFRHTLENP